MAAVHEIIREMEEGLAGAQRSVNSARRNADRIRSDLDEHQRQVEHWGEQARDRLAGSDENGASEALQLKQEHEDLSAGLEREHEAATATWEHLTTTQRALEARLADARRRQMKFEGSSVQTPEQADRSSIAMSEQDITRSARVEAELEALKPQLNGA